MTTFVRKKRDYSSIIPSSGDGGNSIEPLIQFLEFIRDMEKEKEMAV